MVADAPCLQLTERCGAKTHGNQGFFMQGMPGRWHGNSAVSQCVLGPLHVETYWFCGGPRIPCIVAEIADVAPVGYNSGAGFQEMSVLRLSTDRISG